MMNGPITIFRSNAAAAVARITGADVTTTSTSLVDITGLTLALTANTTYEIEASLFTTTSADTTGIRYGINFSTSGATVIAGITGSRALLVAITSNLAAFNTESFTFMTSSAQDGFMFFKGIVTVGANAGNLTLQHTKVTSGTSTVKTGSFLKATPL